MTLVMKNATLIGLFIHEIQQKYISNSKYRPCLFKHNLEWIIIGFIYLSI
jgi:hypothetical protein